MSWPVLFTHRIDARTLSLSLCLCQLELAGHSPRRDSQALCLTSSGRVLVFLCDSLVSQWHISRLFVRAMTVAALRKSSKSTPGRSTNQSWSPNSGQITEDESQGPTSVLASEHKQQPPASSLTMQQHQNTQTGSQTQSATSLTDQLQGCVGPVPAFWERSDSTRRGRL